MKNGTPRNIHQTNLLLKSFLEVNNLISFENGALQSEDGFRRMVESISQYFYSVEIQDGKYGRTIHSPGCYLVTGFTPQEFENNPNLWFQIIHEDDKKRVLENLDSAKKVDILPPFEHRLVKKKGEVRWVRNNSFVRKNVDNIIFSLEGIIVDITEEKRSREEILRMNQKLEQRVVERTMELLTVNSELQIISRFQDAILNGTNYLIVSTDKKGIIRSINETAQKYLGYTAQELIGKETPAIFRNKSVFHEDSKQESLFYIEPSNEAIIIKAQKQLPDEIVCTLSPKGRPCFPVQLSITTLKDHLGNVTGFLGIAKDFTQLRKAEEERIKEELHILRLLNLNQMIEFSEKELVKFSLDGGKSLTGSEVCYAIFANQQGSGFSEFSWITSEGFEFYDGNEKEEPDFFTQELWKDALQEHCPFSIQNNPVFPCFKKMVNSIAISFRNHLRVSLFEGNSIVVVAGMANKKADYTEIEAKKLSILMYEMWRLVYRKRIEKDQETLRKALVKAREQEIKIGFQIQKTLLMGKPPKGILGAKIEALTIPSLGIDGDFFDFLVHSSQCFDVFAGDVMGKGLTAALVGAATRSYFHQAISYLLLNSARGTFPSPIEIVEKVHSEITPQLSELESFVCLHMARFDMKQMQMNLINCGHTQVIHFRKRSGKCELIPETSTALGINFQEKYPQLSITFGPGDLFLFYSDGLTEARNLSKEFFGINRLCQLAQKYALCPPHEIAEQICSAVFSFSASKDLSDDLTLVIVSIDNII
ncbi:MAG: SpoIIE family protein phosphatase [Candidatus Riflebacteria bacterium]|nr:SpoIIE family protein phosphatase [Candidatus Riflebacteria bacterium]